MNWKNLNHYIGRTASRLIQSVEVGRRKGTALLFVAGVSFAFVILIVTFIDVVGRYFFDNPLTGALDISRWAAAGMFFLTLAYTQARKGHVDADVLYVRFPRWLQSRLDVVSSFLVLIVAGVMAYAAVPYALHAFLSEPISYGIPQYPFKFLIFIGALALTTQLIRDFVDSCRRIVSR